jgi:outer membrane protein, multidrug efflux system
MTAVRLLATCSLVLALTACLTVGPDYHRPELPLPAGYAEAEAEPGAPGAAVPDAWWTLFGDPALTRLVEEALAANQDLAAAAARVAEARALAGIAQSERFPQVSVTAGASRTELSTDTAPIPPGFDIETDSVRLAGTVAYELDFWGRLRRLTEAAREELLASEEGRRNLALAVASEAAAAYFDLLSLDEQVRIARETLGTRSELARLQKVRFDAGTISELDLAQAESEVAAAEATLPVLERQTRQVENRLAVLRGRFGGTVERAAPGALAEIAAPEVPVGLPSELLLRRPDVREVERRLAAANARIGAARAAYFPNVVLTGYAGSESAQLAGLFGSGTGIWQVAAALVGPIFNAGRTRREVEAAQAREQQALAAYTGTLQIAFAEVEDALVARRTGVAEREALTRQVEALSRSLRLANLRYEAGESSFIEVLDAQRTLFRAQLVLVESRRFELQSTVTLFKALGGGWQEAPAAPATDGETPATAVSNVSPADEPQ